MLSSFISNTSFTTEMLIIDGASSYFVQKTTKLPEPLYQLSIESISAYIEVSKNYQQMALIFSMARPGGNLNDLVISTVCSIQLLTSRNSVFLISDSGGLILIQIQSRQDSEKRQRLHLDVP